MGICSVFECNNTTRKKLTADTSFHKFPKRNVNLADQWISFCKRNDHINIQTARICSLHFEKDDFINNVKYEMGFTPFRFLKPDAVPTVYLKATPKNTASDSKKRSERRDLKQNKKLQNNLLEDSVPDEFESDIQNGDDSLMSNVSESMLILVSSDEIKSLNEEIKTLRRENTILKTKLSSAEESITSLRTRMEKAEFYQNNLESKLSEIFTPGQILKIRIGSLKRSNWSEEDIARSITLYSSSSRAYKLLKRKKFPLPAVRTLQTWAQKLDITPGVIMPVTQIMKASMELTQNQKLCVLSFDEMKVKESYCYDKTTDIILKPASYVQVGMLRGLIEKWKQPIFYDFDCKMTKSILLDIIRNVGNCGFTTVAITSDLGGANRGLYTELGVSMDKPWFLFGDTKLYVFANVPHLIKQIRNHFVDHGFMLNGKIVNKDIISKLLSLRSEELSIAHKISTESINVVQADRQKMKLATNLFSHTVAKALSQAVSLGLLKDESWEECYNLLKYTNDWFDVMNVRSPYSDSRDRVHAYGLNLESQNIILNNMTQMISNMRVVGKNNLLSFQKGIVQSNTALQSLQKDMQDRFGVKCIMTYRLNQDLLENFFGVIRAKGGPHDYPDSQEFKCGLRSYILGQNEGPRSDNGNVGVDDTPDLRLEEKCLSGKIFSILKVSKTFKSEPEKDLPMAYDDLENLAGYICHRLKNTIPNLEDGYIKTESWVKHLDGGGLYKPSETLMLSLENVFNTVNGESNSIYISTQYIKHMMEISNEANIVCDDKIKKLFFRSRMYTRIRKLNREVVESKNGGIRKYNKIINLREQPIESVECVAEIDPLMLKDGKERCDPLLH